MNFKNLGACLLLLVLGLAGCAGEPEGNRLRLDVYYKFKNERYEVWCYIINEGGTIFRAARSSIGPDSVGLKDNYVLLFQTPDFRSQPRAQTPDGHLVVMPESAMGIVNLFPGEAATFWKQDLNSVPRKVVYRISPEFGRRFNIWHGALEAIPRPWPGKEEKSTAPKAKP
jgi:hypothetical protein